MIPLERLACGLAVVITVGFGTLTCVFTINFLAMLAVSAW